MRGARCDTQLQLPVQVAQPFLRAHSFADVAKDPSVSTGLFVLTGGTRDGNGNRDALTALRLECDLPVVESVEVADAVKLVTVFLAASIVEKRWQRLPGEKSRLDAEQSAGGKVGFAYGPVQIGDQIRVRREIEKLAVIGGGIFFRLPPGYRPVVLFLSVAWLARNIATVVGRGLLTGVHHLPQEVRRGRFPQNPAICNYGARHRSERGATQPRQNVSCKCSAALGKKRRGTDLSMPRSLSVPAMVSVSRRRRSTRSPCGLHVKLRRLCVRRSSLLRS